MYPELFRFQLPELMKELFSINEITIYSYPFLIFIGALLGYSFFIYAQKKQLGVVHLGVNLLVILVCMVFLGGKVFLLIDNPENYLERLVTIEFYTSGGFVFYGSFLFGITAFIYLIRRKNLPLLLYLDIIAISITIVHAFGRFGCFLAGCCFGKETNSSLGIMMENTSHNKVLPTQLFEAIFIGVLFFVLVQMQKKKQSHGTIFNTYIFSYASWRFFIEFFRGDERGYVFNNLLSHSQFIALCLISILLVIQTQDLYQKKNTH